MPKPKDPATDPHAPKPGDSEAVAEWRAPMGTEEAKTLHKERAATAECVNALARERGLIRLRVRGQRKVRGVLLLHAVAHNLMRTFALAPALLGLGTTAPAMVEVGRITGESPAMGALGDRLAGLVGWRWQNSDAVVSSSPVHPSVDVRHEYRNIHNLGGRINTTD